MRRATGFGGTHVALAASVLVGLGAVTSGLAQTDAPTPRDGAALEIEGIWVSVVTEDWKFRMVTPDPGVYDGIPLNAAGRAEADGWDAASGDLCRLYGAANLMRVPARFRIDWQDDSTLRIASDAGGQTRLLRFDQPPGAAAMQSGLQGISAAEWRYAVGESADTAIANHGSLAVRTWQLAPGLLRGNGVPYSAETTMTEYFNVFDAPNGDQLLVVTAIVEDPVYLSRPFYTSSHFKRLPDNAEWRPTAC